jgi:hypothetical protein
MRSRQHLCHLLLIAAAILAVYANSFSNGFHFDDVPVILENARLKDLRLLPQLVTEHRGVCMATFALNYAVGGLNVFGYHLVNVGIHLANAILVYLLVFRTLTLSGAAGEEGRGLPAGRLALFSALLFALHPIQTQAVNYIVQRMEILASLFYLLGLVLFVNAAAAPGRIARALLYGGVAGAYLLGLQSKEIVITLPAVILLYDFFFIAGGSLGKLAGRWPVHLALFGLMIFFALRIIGLLGGFSAPAPAAPSTSLTAGAMAGFAVQTITPREYLYTQFNVLLYYIVLLLVPANLNVDYDFPVSRGLFEWPRVSEGTVLNIPLPPPAISLAILLGIVTVAFGLYLSGVRRSRPELKVMAFFVFWFFIILAPTSSFVPVLDVIFEHRVYLAAAGYAVILVLALDKLLAAARRRPGGPFIS